MKVLIFHQSKVNGVYPQENDLMLSVAMDRMAIKFLIFAMNTFKQ